MKTSTLPVRVLAALAATAAFASQAQERLAPAEHGEFGVRYWLSTGETKRSHNAQGLDPSVGNPTSVLLFENLDANVVELFARQSFRRNWFLKAQLGIGRINRGSFDDEDFLAGQVKFSDTTSSIPQGSLGYGSFDVGYQWVLGPGRATVGVFAGYGQWREQVDAFGATDHLGFVGGDISRDVAVVSNAVVWKALRVGFAGSFVLGGKSRLVVDLAAVPYAEYTDEDSHHLRDDLGPVPNIILEGRGVGAQLDAELRYEILPRTELALGARYWHMKSTDGHRQLPNIPGFPEVPVGELYTKRVGVTLGLSHLW